MNVISLECWCCLSWYVTLTFRSPWMVDSVKMLRVQLRVCNGDGSSGSLAMLGGVPCRPQDWVWKQRCRWLAFLGGGRRQIPPGYERKVSMCACPWEGKSLFLQGRQWKALLWRLFAPTVLTEMIFMTSSLTLWVAFLFSNSTSVAKVIEDLRAGKMAV